MICSQPLWVYWAERFIQLTDVDFTNIDPLVPGNLYFITYDPANCKQFAFVEFTPWVGGQNILTIEDEWAAQCVNPTQIDFVWAWVTATCVAWVATVTIPARQNMLAIQDEWILQCTNPTTFNFVGAWVIATCVAWVTTVTIPSGGAWSFWYAEYVQHTQWANVSIAPGRAVEYTIDNPAGVYNTLGILTASWPAAQGTAFQLPVWVYMVDYENSADAAWSLAIYQWVSNVVLGIDVESISGASTATTWIHGRHVVTSSVGNDWIMISPVTGTQAIPTAGTAAGEFIARITFLKIA